MVSTALSTRSSIFNQCLIRPDNHLSRYICLIALNAAHCNDNDDDDDDDNRDGNNNNTITTR